MIRTRRNWRSVNQMLLDRIFEDDALVFGAHF